MAPAVPSAPQIPVTPAPSVPDITLQPPGESVRDELQKLRNRISELEQQRDQAKLDKRFQDLASQITLGLDKADAERAVLRGDLGTIAEQLQRSNAMLSEISSKVDGNALLLSKPIQFQMQESGTNVGSLVPKRLGETLYINRELLK